MDPRKWVLLHVYRHEMVWLIFPPNLSVGSGFPLGKTMFGLKGALLLRGVLGFLSSVFILLVSLNVSQD